MTDEVLSVHMPAGTYYVGDPCYVVPDHRWMEWLALADPDVFGENPTRTDGGTARIMNAELDGHPVLGIGTKYGDGVYVGSDGERYGVDAGLIGVVSVEIADATGLSLGSVVKFDRPFTCSYEDGTIVLGHISIPTGDDDVEYCGWCGEVEDWCSCDDSELDEDDE